MNDQHKANELDKLIDQLQTGQNTTPSADEAFAARFVQLVDQIQPDPTFAAHLEARLQAPIATNEEIMRATYRRSYPLRWLAYGTAAVTLLVVIVSVPPLGALAQGILARLFNQTAEDTVIFETPYSVNLQATPVTQAVYATPGTLAAAQNAVDFTLKVPAYVPEGYTLYDASTDAPGQVTLSYARNGFMLNITQSRIEDAPLFEVGASAQIIPVQIGDVQGEYVEGYWIADLESSGDEGVVSGKLWENTHAYQQMRWIDNSIVYWTHSAVGSGTDLPLEEWIALAESLQ